MTAAPPTVPEAPDDALPVTVSITRHVEPARTDQMIAWVRAGSSLAERFPGFLGTGWVRPAADSEVWHMLYRFDSARSLAAWEASSQRAWWLESALGLVGESRTERRTGIEGWFDAPAGRDVADPHLSEERPAPPRWKQAVMIWTAFFPLSLVLGLLLARLAPGLAILPRVLATTPVMTYVVLPQLTRRLEWWLHGRTAPWRG